MCMHTMVDQRQNRIFCVIRRIHRESESKCPLQVQNIPSLQPCLLAQSSLTDFYKISFRQHTLMSVTGIKFVFSEFKIDPNIQSAQTDFLIILIKNSPSYKNRQ